MWKNTEDYLFELEGSNIYVVKENKIESFKLILVSFVILK